MSLLHYILKTLIYFFTPKTKLVAELLVKNKEIEILKRKLQKQVRTKFKDRVLFIALDKIINIKNIIRIVQPETMLSWKDEIIKRKWIHRSKNKRVDLRLIRRQSV